MKLCVVIIAVLCLAASQTQQAAAGWPARASSHSHSHHHSATGKGSSCPLEWFDAQFVSSVDMVMEGADVTLPDPQLTFFRNTMEFTEEEIEEVTEDAITFLYERFGLDFSQSQPDENGRRVFENAEFFPYLVNPNLQYTITLNRYIPNKNTNSFCFENRDGGFLIDFTGDQLLRGTYGGEDGLPVTGNDFLLYGFYNILVFNKPVIIQYQSGTPFRFEPIDGFNIINCELFHDQLGAGLAQGVLRATPIPDDRGLFHINIRNVFSFPGNPALNGLAGAPIDCDDHANRVY